MIKIIKEGKSKQKNVNEYNTTCPDCECEFTYQFEDTEKGIYTDMVYCPNVECQRNKCGHGLEVSYVPQFVE